MADPNRDIKPRLPRLPGQSGLNVKPRLPRLPGQRGRASLVAAAASAKSGPSRAVEESGPSRAVESGPSAEGMDVDAEAAGGPAGDSAAATAAPGASSGAAASSATAPAAAAATPTPRPVAGPSSVSMATSRSGSGAPSSAPATGPKMKFKPKMPIRRAAPDVEVKAEPGAPAVRGRGPRGRGRGGARGGRGGAANTIAAGPFGGTRAPTQRRLAVPPPPPRNLGGGAAEVYSDNEDGTGRTGVIDIEAVSALSESAPTSMFRDRDVDGSKAKAKAADKAKLKDLKKRRKAQRAERAARAARLAAGDLGGVGGDAAVDVKAEPESPLQGPRPLPDPSSAEASARVADSMIPGDEIQDRDEAGRRVPPPDTPFTDGTPDTEVNEAQRVDLSESESEDEEEDMEGDFVYVPGLDNPEDKLFTFQFPPGMPRFVSRQPIDADTLPDDAPENQKPTPAALKRKKGGPVQPPQPPPEGRIGTLCVMKSGKVKLVLGEGEAGIVMNVAPGVPTTFIQQLVHMDAKHKSTTVLGEVHKQYVVTPDIDRLLEELFINGGETPGDRARQLAEHERRVKMERGLVKMEPSSP